MSNKNAKDIMRYNKPKQQQKEIKEDKAELSDEELHGVTGGLSGPAARPGRPDWSGPGD